MFFKTKVEAESLKKSGLFKDFSLVDYSEKAKRKVITPDLFKDQKNQKKLNEILSKNIFTEDQYFNLSFNKVKIYRIVFAFCDLVDCDFSGAILTRCDFSFANLNNCNFSNAIMSECSFRHAHIKNSDFSGVDDFLCDFQGVIFNTQESFL